MRHVISLLLLMCGVPWFAWAGENIVIIDPGHGGHKDSGTQEARTLSASNNAKSPAGLPEKDLTLALSVEIKKQVQALASAHPDTKIECVLTRTDDSNPDFAERTATCTRYPVPPAVIFSIHFNASEDHHALGTLAVIHHAKLNKNYDADKSFAQGLINAASKGVHEFVPNSKPLSPISDAHLHQGAGSNFFHQLALNPSLKNVPKCFLEVEFMDRHDVEEKLLTVREKAFPAIARQIAEYLYTYCAAKSR